MGARRKRDSTHSQERTRSSGRSGTTKDDGESSRDSATVVEQTVAMQVVFEIIERECTNLYRACALLDCLRVAAMYDDYHEEVEPGDVAYVARGLVSDVLHALDRVELQKAARQRPPEPP
jgi:hypothetical protein